ncbi:MAG: MqnA/MqnD/SBP family protein [Rhodothermales bacterium]
MKIAVWNTLPADLLASGFASGPHKERFDIRRVTEDECERLLREREVDVALLPTLAVLRGTDDFDVLPAVALSSWSYPFARLVIDHGLDEPVARVAFDSDHEQEAFLTRLTLREHYKMEPEFVSMPGAPLRELLEADADAHLLVGASVPTMSFDRLTLDIGQEWYELAQYPMCWGLFVARKHEAGPDTIRAIRLGVEASEKHRNVWIRAQETSQDLHVFYAEDLRLRLDDLIESSLSEYRQYLFFYELIEDVRDIPVVYLDEDEEEEEDSDEAPRI